MPSGHWPMDTASTNNTKFHTKSNRKSKCNSTMKKFCDPLYNPHRLTLRRSMVLPTACIETTVIIIRYSWSV